ncbi:MAG: winged helix-turn-helix transcriptional regulator [Candidatus Sungiibacteriota bacterium]|uniref:Winged helix-turn-helix transcriptional regulator n=1 Tax=Candidatus Sungiibacteriota bacterium TaxID=2750080 RepID=A0A7T5UPR0_9BACT|nr:MAG: winged helix-turn-helix transcriptional regulator [Candidatus Sungbacteria bacterium]
MTTKEVKVTDLSRRLALFSDPVRLRLFLFLFSSGEKDLCVSDIAAYLKSSLSNTSHQLRKLELAGFARPVRHGRMICYQSIKTDTNKLLYTYLTRLMRRGL